MISPYKYICLFFGLWITTFVVAQPPTFRRDPQDIAMKQTIMLDREVNLDSFQLNAIYQMHLRYAQEFMATTTPPTREQLLHQREQINAELRTILSKAQYQLFLRKMGDTTAHCAHHNIIFADSLSKNH